MYSGAHISVEGGWARLKNRMARARYFRGHGVHSPYVYDIVREVFMQRALLVGDRSLWRALRSAGLSERQAIQLQNLAIHCGCNSFGIDSCDSSLVIITPSIDRATTLEMVRHAAETRAMVVILDPYHGQERQALCAQIVAGHTSTTIDKWHFLIVMNNHLPKQHFQL